MCYQDTALLKDLVAEAKKLNDIGGDWDRRNRLKVYEAYYLLTVRDLKGVSTLSCAQEASSSSTNCVSFQASKILLDCVATFTCVELCTYKQFMFYTLLTSLIALDRNSLRKKVRLLTPPCAPPPPSPFTKQATQKTFFARFSFIIYRLFLLSGYQRPARDHDCSRAAARAGPSQHHLPVRLQGLLQGGAFLLVYFLILCDLLRCRSFAE